MCVSERLERKKWGLITLIITVISLQSVLDPSETQKDTHLLLLFDYRESRKKWQELERQSRDEERGKKR